MPAIEDEDIADGNMMDEAGYEGIYRYGNGKNGIYYKISPISLAVFFFLAIFVVAEGLLLFFRVSLYVPDAFLSLVPYGSVLFIPGIDEMMSRQIVMLISSVLVLADAGLHVFDTRRNLKVSFGITSAMLLGLGVNIGLQTPAFAGYDLLYYCVFTAVCIAFVVDFYCILEYPEDMELALKGEDAIVQALAGEKESEIEEVKIKEEELASEEEQLKMKNEEISGIQTELADKLSELEEETELLKTKEEELEAMQAKLEERLEALSEEEEIMKMKEQELAEAKAKLEEMRAELEEEEEILKSKGEELENVMMEKFEERMKELEEEEERLKMKEQEIEETIKQQIESKLAEVEEEEERLKMKAEELEKEKVALQEEMEKLKVKSDELSALESKLRAIDLHISKELERLCEIQRLLDEREREYSENYLRMVLNVLPKVRRLADRAEYVYSVLEEKGCEVAKEKMSMISGPVVVSSEDKDISGHIIDVDMLDVGVSSSKKVEGLLAGVLANKASELRKELGGEKITLLPDEDKIYKEGSARDELIGFKRDVEDVKSALVGELEEEKWRKYEEDMRKREKNMIIAESAALDEDSILIYDAITSASVSMLENTSERARRIVDMLEKDRLYAPRIEKFIELAAERACSICYSSYPAECEWCPNCGVKIVRSGERAW